MTTEVVLTGTGVPHVHPERAGAGTFVRSGDTRLQFDAGRATSMRLAAIGVPTRDLDALFITHHHSDHLVGLVDLVFCRWLENHGSATPLTVIAPEGPASRFVERMLDPWEDDIIVRAEHVSRDDRPDPVLETFTAGDSTEVWLNGDARVLARSVHHEPVLPAVGYRVETADGVIAISGDTSVCAEVEELAAGADVLVHESFHTSLLEPAFDHIPHLRHIAAYHADTHGVGALAARAGVRTLVLTHLIPAPRHEDDEKALTEVIRSAGYEGDVVIGRDLTSVVLP